MTDKLRVYLYFDESVGTAARPEEAGAGRPSFKTKAILSSAEDQAQPLSLLIAKFCEKYNAQADLKPEHRIEQADVQLKLGDTLLKPNAQPLTNYVSDYNDVHIVFLPPRAAAVQHEEGSVPCSNFGCGRRFVPGRDDTEEDCRHHGGRPVFHDTYKYWSCCSDRKHLDFADFEKVEGCVVGKHRHDPVSAAVMVGGSGGANNALDRKPLTDEELKALEEEKKGGGSPAGAGAAAAVASPASISSDEPCRGPREFTGAAAKAAEPQKPDAEGRYRCRRYGCQQKFKPEENSETACRYHPQGPVFHDTYKYWKCCPTSKHADFDDFEKVVGCTVGAHLQ